MIFVDHVLLFGKGKNRDIQEMKRSSYWLFLWHVLARRLISINLKVLLALHILREFPILCAVFGTFHQSIREFVLCVAVEQERIYEDTCINKEENDTNNLHAWFTLWVELCPWDKLWIIPLIKLMVIWENPSRQLLKIL